jgi:large subunit ribosomal protein L35Ae
MSRECLIQFTHANSVSEAGQLIGRKVVWKDGKNKFIGKIMGFHGKKGLVRVKFRKGVPGQALGTSVELVGALTRVPSVKKEVGKGSEKMESAIPIHPTELTSIEGIGVKRAEKLKSCGVRSVQDLASFDPKELSEKLQVSEKVVSKWVNEAKNAIKE